MGILKEGFWEEAWLCRVRVGFGGREGALASTLIYIMGIIHIYIIYIYVVAVLLHIESRCRYIYNILYTILNFRTVLKQTASKL